ncbi:MAG: hypothetical protein ABI778_02050 [Ignavibacteriota bacterium]
MANELFFAIREMISLSTDPLNVNKQMYRQSLDLFKMLCVPFYFDSQQQLEQMFQNHSKSGTSTVNNIFVIGNVVALHVTRMTKDGESNTIYPCVWDDRDLGLRIASPDDYDTAFIDKVHHKKKIDADVRRMFEAMMS